MLSLHVSFYTWLPNHLQEGHGWEATLLRPNHTWSHNLRPGVLFSEERESIATRESVGWKRDWLKRDWPPTNRRVSRCFSSRSSKKKNAWSQVSDRREYAIATSVFDLPLLPFVYSYSLFISMTWRVVRPVPQLGFYRGFLASFFLWIEYSPGYPKGKDLTG